MESDNPRSVVRDIVGTLGLFSGDFGTLVEHERITVDNPIPRMPRPPAGASPQRPQPNAEPAQPSAVPATIDGYAAAFSRQMAGLPPPVPATMTTATTTAPTIPQASAPPLSGNSNETTPQQHIVSSDSGRLSPTANDVAEKLDSYIDHNDNAMQTLSDRTHRLKQDVDETQHTLQQVVATHHQHSANCGKLNFHQGNQADQIASLTAKVTELESRLRLFPQ